MYTASVARQREAVNTWSWREELLDDLEASFSPERLDTYLAVAQGDRERALKLYTRNTELSAAFYGPLQGLEVALRNALHRELTRLYGAAWYDNLVAGLDRGALERIADAKRKIAPGGGTVTPSKMVARLSFGFWVSLLGSGGRLDAAGRRANYEMTLWRPALRRAFPYRTPLTRIQATRGFMCSTSVWRRSTACWSCPGMSGNRTRGSVILFCPLRPPSRRCSM